MSNKKEREKRREERLQEETKVDSGERRTRLLQIGAGAVFLAIVAVVVLIVASSGSDSGGDAEQPRRKSAQVDSLVSGIPQNGHGARRAGGQGRTDRVRRPAVPGLQRLFGRSPAAGDRKPGRQTAKRRSTSATSRSSANSRLPPAPPRSPPATRAAAGTSSSSSTATRAKRTPATPTDEFLTAVAKGAGVKDIAKWDNGPQGAKVAKEVEETTELAQTSASTARRRSRSRARAPTGSSCSATSARRRNSKQRSTKPASYRF